MILYMAYEAAKASDDQADEIHTAVVAAAGKANVQRALHNVWLIVTDIRPSEWVDRVEAALKKGDKLLISRLQRGTAGLNVNAATTWIAEHREDFT